MDTRTGEWKDTPKVHNCDYIRRRNEEINRAIMAKFGYDKKPLTHEEYREVYRIVELTKACNKEALAAVRAVPYNM